MSNRNSNTGCSCECRSGSERPTPQTIYNRPSLSSIEYRVGSFGTFRQAMIESIVLPTPQDSSTPEGSPLRQWTVRSSDDFGIALLEMWAYLADILTFYQERIANEAFLRTAKQQKSLLCLASMLDYKPPAGMAATAKLALTVEEGKQVDVPVGLRVQSVPGQDEKPQKFETVVKIQARSQLNRLRVYPKPTEGDPGSAKNSSLTVVSDISHVAPGDNLVIWEEFQSLRLRPDADTMTGADVLPAPGERRVLHVEDKRVTHVHSVGWRQVLEFTPQIRSSFRKDARRQKWTRKMALFGKNAPAQFLAPVVVRNAANAQGVTFTLVEYDHTSSVEPNAAEKQTRLTLDGVYDDLKENTELLIVARKPDLTMSDLAKRVQVVQVEQVQAEVRGKIPPPPEAQPPVIPPLIQASVTQVTVNGKLPALDSRHTVIYELQGPELYVWSGEYEKKIPVGSDVFIPLKELGVEGDDALDVFEEGRSFVLADKDGQALSATVDDCGIVRIGVIHPPRSHAASGSEPDVRHLRITFSPALSRPLDSATSVLYGNIVEATHGETVAEEVLGSGDASAEFQNFALKKSPVTHVPRPGAPGGAGSTLKIDVGGVRWHETRTLYGQPPDARVFTTRIDHDAAMTVQFGDGTTGARLPTGRNNVTASYRQGIGKDGNVAEDTLTTLLDKPVGLTAATNPNSAVGGAEPETSDRTRANVPNTVRTFERIVSLRDFEDAARQYVGIAKARAVLSGYGPGQIVHLTVAGDDGAKVVDPTLTNLRNDLNARRDPNRPMCVTSFQPLPIEIEVRIFVRADYRAEDVRTDVTAALVQFMHFDELSLGQSINLSDLFKVAHDVKGVVGVDVECLQFKGTDGMTVQPWLPVADTKLAVIEDPIQDVRVNLGTQLP